MIKGRLFDEELGQGGRSHPAGQRGVEARGLGVSPDQNHPLPPPPIAAGERMDPARGESRPVDLEMEAQVVNERERRPPVEVGAEEGGPGGVPGVVPQLGELAGLLVNPPAGRREDEADLVFDRPRGLQVEERRDVGDGDEAARDLLVVQRWGARRGRSSASNRLRAFRPARRLAVKGWDSLSVPK